MIGDIYHPVSDFEKGFVKLRRGSGYIVHKSDEIEIAGFSESGLLKNDEVLYYIEKGRAHVVHIVKRGTVYVVGVIRKKRKNVSFFPDDPAFRSFEVVNLNRYPGLDDLLKVRCHISDYRRRKLKIDEIVGYSYDPGIQEKSILLSYDVHPEFPRNVEAEAASFDRSVSLEGRRDLRDECFITIDGDDSKDFDDSICVRENDEGYILYVSIADVSAYVKEGSFLDREASKRGTSIYYPGHVIPMLPFALSDDLCSLLPHQDRYALTCEMHYDYAGEMIDHSIYPSVIRSKYRMTYSKVNRILDNDEELKNEYRELTPMIYRARLLYSLLNRRRMKNGGIDFASDECIIIEDDGVVTDIRPRELGTAEKMIEDFMIAANVTVAEHLFYLDLPCIYRNHDLPKSQDLAGYVDIVSSLGYVFKGNRYELNSRQLADSLVAFEGKNEYPVVSDLLLRCMVKAKYENVCAGHFGLGLDHYCHFTSPIRRYPDLIVHRMLHRYVFAADYSDAEKDMKRNEEIALSANESERLAVSVERDITDLKKCEYMKGREGEVYDGVISSVTGFGVYVKLDNTVEGLVHISRLNGYFEPDGKGSLSDGRTTYSLGDRVKIAVDFVDVYRGTIDFELLRKY